VSAWLPRRVRTGLTLLLACAGVCAQAEGAVQTPSAPAQPAPVGGPYRHRLQAKYEYRDLGAAGARRAIVARGDYAFTPDVVVRIDAPFAASDPDKLVLSSTPELGDILLKATWRPVNTPRHALFVALEVNLESDLGYRVGDGETNIAPELALQVPVADAGILEAGVRYFRQADFAGGAAVDLLRPRLQLGWRLPQAWSAEARAQFYFDLRDAPYRRDDTLILEAEAGRGVGRNLQVLLGGGWRLYGDQGYRWGLDATLRWLFR
jgi:hypothetical protein